MGPKKKLLTISISSTALFDLSESERVYREEGLEAYRNYQITAEDEVLQPGEGFALVKKILNINTFFKEPRVEVILLSRNSADTGLRVFNSIAAHNLGITRAAFCSGKSPYRYTAAFGSDLFLSTNSDDVRGALEQGVPSATLLSRPGEGPKGANESLNIAFDADAVLFSDEAEKVFQKRGLRAFSQHESDRASEALGRGPFKSFLEALHTLQKEFPEGESPIRTTLVTARSAPAHERIIRTLRYWDIRLDESLFLGGMDKTEFLKNFGADIFFDDLQSNCDRAADYLLSGHVPHGVAND